MLAAFYTCGDTVQELRNQGPMRTGRLPRQIPGGLMGGGGGAAPPGVYGIGSGFGPGMYVPGLAAVTGTVGVA